jgi:hypothetical protein
MADTDLTAEANDISTIEIAPMRDLSGSGIVTIRPVRPGETADLWSVIARMNTGRLHVLADEPDHDTALAHAKRICQQLSRSRPTLRLDIVER